MADHVREEPASDGELASRARCGDTEAFGELVRRHQARALRAALRVAGNAADAADACQEAFVRGFRLLSRFDPSRDFGAWVARIAINRALTRAGRRRALEPLEEAEAVAEPAASPEAVVTREDEGERVRRAVQELSPSDRALLAMRYEERLPVAEIAAALGIREGAVKVRLLRARERLMKRLAPEGLQGPGEEDA